MEEYMTEKELTEKLIEQYAALQRIAKAENREKEIEYQQRVLKAKLEALGVVTEKLDY